MQTIQAVFAAVAGFIVADLVFLEAINTVYYLHEDAFQLAFGTLGALAGVLFLGRTRG